MLRLSRLIAASVLVVSTAACDGASMQALMSGLQGAKKDDRTGQPTQGPGNDQYFISLDGHYFLQSSENQSQSLGEIDLVLHRPSSTMNESPQGGSQPPAPPAMKVLGYFRAAEGTRLSNGRVIGVFEGSSASPIVRLMVLPASGSTDASSSVPVSPRAFKITGTLRDGNWFGLARAEFANDTKVDGAVGLWRSQPPGWGGTLKPETESAPSQGRPDPNWYPDPEWYPGAPNYPDPDWHPNRTSYPDPDWMAGQRDYPDPDW